MTVAHWKDDARLTSFLAGFPDRAGGPGEPDPAHAFVALDDAGGPAAALVAYEVPPLGTVLSFFTSLSHPMLHLGRLVAAFDLWALSVEQPVYYFVISRRDVYYQKIIKRVGGVVVGENASDLLYMRQANPDGVRDYHHGAIPAVAG